VIHLVIAGAAAAFIEDEDTAVEAGELDGGGEAGGPTPEDERIVDKVRGHGGSMRRRPLRERESCSLFDKSSRRSPAALREGRHVREPGHQ